MTNHGYAETTKLKQSNQELHRVNKQISQLKKVMTHARDKRSTLLNEMHKTEVVIGRLSEELLVARHKIKQKTVRINQLATEHQQQQEKLSKQYQMAAKQMRLMYQTGQNPLLKVLLSQEKVPELQRQLEYFRYFNQARMREITELRQTVRELHTTQLQIHQQHQQLQHMLGHKQAKREQYVAAKEYNHHVVNKLGQLIKSKEQRIQELNQDKKNLANIIARLQASRANAPVDRHSPAAIAFKRPFKNMTWPTNGTIKHHFGQSIDGTSITYNGIFIEAPLYQDVRAIYAGKVIFASWLKGFGLLLIIDHGAGYMSLYAHNHSLFRKIGESVKTGELIARIGQTGGQGSSGLYFEIRHNGKPLNPEA